MFFDTADAYGAGHCERILGQALKRRRAQAVISTKFGNVCDEAARQVTLRDGLAPTPEEIRRACQASLRRLQTNYLDLYHLHIWAIPFEDVPLVLDTLDELVAQGHIRAYAWSTDLVEGARRFAKRPNCAAVQFELNVLQDAPDMLALCETSDLAAVVRSPLAMGLLSGKYSASSQLPENDIRGNAPDWMKYFTAGRPNPDWYRRLEAVRAVLTNHGRTLAQGALAWVWARSPRTIPIPGFKTVQQVEENAAALEFGPLRPEQMREIDALLGR
jgi:aryl-alcohol dehydrogenase-like predicted oxidoreductase